MSSNAVGSYLRHVANPADTDELNQGARGVLDGTPLSNNDSPRFEDWSPEKQRAAYEGLVREDAKLGAIKTVADEFISLHPEMPDIKKNGEAIARNLKLMFGDVVFNLEHFQAAYDVACANGALQLDGEVIAKRARQAEAAKHKAAQDKRFFEANRQFNPDEDYSNLSLDELRQRANAETQRDLERRAVQEGLR
jgi:hypothetical protein